jgi:hypothetical protein
MVCIVMTVARPEHTVLRPEPLAPPRPTRRVLVVLGTICALLYVNWLFAIARFQPNVMFMDQWDFLRPLFDGEGSWKLFVQQQGPVREGLGLVVTGWILKATSWDVRYDSVWVVTVLLVATVLALRLKWKMTGTLRLGDAWIALFGLSLGQFETVVIVSHVSHSVLPLALILLAANLWLDKRSGVRYLGAGITALTLTFTAFGLFASGMIAVLLGARIIRHVLDREYRAAVPAIAASAVITAGWLLFSRGYVFEPSVSNFRFPWSPWTDYVHFIVVMLNLPTAQVGAGPRHYLLGTALMLVIATGAVGIARVWMKRRPTLNEDVLLLLIGSGLLFVITTAIGRVSLGTLAGFSSRYLSLMFTLWLAVYLVAATSYRRMLPLATICVWSLVVLPYTSMYQRPLADWPGTVGVGRWQIDTMMHFGTNKAEWARVYLATGRWESAQAAVLQPLHPNPGASRFDEKLRFLRERRLSFFSGQPERGDYLPWLAGDDFGCTAARSKPRHCP